MHSCTVIYRVSFRNSLGRGNSDPSGWTMLLQITMGVNLVFGGKGGLSSLCNPPVCVVCSLIMCTSSCLSPMSRFSASQLAASCLLEARILLGQGEHQENIYPIQPIYLNTLTIAPIVILTKMYTGNIKN